MGPLLGNASWTLVAALALLADPAAAAGESPPAALHRLLTRLPQANAVCGARVLDLVSGQVWSDVNADEPLLPASNAKVVVLAAAVDQLGPGFTFRTVLAVRGEDLVLIGDGDPALGDEKIAEARGQEQDVFRIWAERLTDLGVTSVPGDLILDETVFDDRWVHPTWEAGDLKKWYAAPVGGLNYNDNCVDVTIWPAETPGAPVLWASIPRADVIQLDNRCLSGGKGTPIIDRPKPTFEFVVKGRCNKRWKFPAVAVPDPGLLAGSALRTALAERGISIAGRIRRQRVRRPDGSLPADCRVLTEHTTPLAAVLARTGRDSQNLFAECLMKRLGYEWARRQGRPHPQGTWHTGRQALAELLARAGAGGGATALVDASGLSRENRATAADLVAVLAYMYRHSQRELFVNSLSEAGDNGSLRRRLQGLEGSVYAKTGYIRGVRTLSGYAVTPEGRWRAFSVLFNGFKGGSAPFNSLHDEVCRVLASDASGTEE